MNSLAETLQRAVTLHKAGDVAQARQIYRQVIRIDPRHADALHLLGVVALQQQQHQDAVEWISQAIAVNPRGASYHSNLGAAYRALGRVSDAIGSYREAVRLRPEYAQAYYNLGNALEENGQPHDAIAAYEQSVALMPEYADAQHNLSSMRRMTGDFQQGWPGYEWRFECDIPRRNLPWPAWDGSSLAGRSILIHAEQGIGDEIMFASCIEEVAEEADCCYVECDSRLVPLFDRSFPSITVPARRDDFRLSADDFPIPIDVQISMGSIPQNTRTELSRFPQAERFLIADSKERDNWKARLATLGDGLKVGISWRGGKNPAIRERRSTRLDCWGPIFSIIGGQFIDLQYDNSREERTAAENDLGTTIHHFDEIDPLAELDNFAALISELDLIVSVDNSTVHLAGALGTPVWALLPYAADWRWMTDRDDSPWYQSVRLFRQKTPGRWDDVFQQTAEKLRQHIATGR